MAKKPRTGLQSKISHIFAGVPIPKKARPLPKPEKPEPESDAYELTPSQDEEPLVVESLAEPSTEIEDKTKEEIDSEEQSQETSVEEPVLEIQDEASTAQEPVIEQQPEIKETDEKRVTPMPIPKEPAIDEPVIEEPALEIPVEVPPVKEPVIEKPVAPIGSAFDVAEVEEPVEAKQQPPLSRTLKADVAQKSAMRITRKSPKRLKGKRVTTKPATSQNKQKTMIALVIVLSIVLVILLVKPFSRFSQNTGGSQDSIVNGSQVPAVSNFQAIEIDWPEPPVYNPDVLRDPMELGQAAKESKELILRGVLISPGKPPLATIGEDQYEVGEEVIPGVIIIEITEDYVEFERDGETWKQNI